MRVLKMDNDKCHHRAANLKKLSRHDVIYPCGEHEMGC